MTPASPLWSEPEMVARCLAAWEGAVPWIAVVGELFRLSLLALAVALALVAWPSWRRTIGRVGAMCLGPMALLVVAGVVIVLHGRAAIEAPGDGAPHRLAVAVALRYLRELTMLAAGAAVALTWMASLREGGRGGDGAPAALFGPQRLRAGAGATWRAARAGIACGAAMTAWSFAVFFTLNMTPHPQLAAFEAGLRALPTAPLVLLMVGMLLAAIVQEELLWRGVGMAVVAAACVRTMDRRAALMVAVVVTALGWTAIHAGSLVFAWAKFAQILPLGLALGLVMARHRMAAAIVAHLLHNAAPYVFVALGGTIPGVVVA